MSSPILEVKNLKKFYEIKTGFREKSTIKALNDVSFTIQPKTTLGIVGETGCGKSTLAKTLMQIVKPTEGDILLQGTSYQAIAPSDYRKKIQMIFQDPYRSLNPRKKAVDIIAEPMIINSNKSKSECHEMAITMMDKVGLRKDYGQRYPHMFSGGQRQRIGIARALIMQPEIVICDEPVSALDVSIQAQVLNLLMDLQDEFGLTYLFISHDLAVVRHLVDHVAVMNSGEIVEYGTRNQIFFNPQHDYTKLLLSSTPKIPGKM
jgi:dipeptide transport system ATP-binding protein